MCFRGEEKGGFHEREKRVGVCRKDEEDSACRAEWVSIAQ
jgi:hypothetical protein